MKVCITVTERIGRDEFYHQINLDPVSLSSAKSAPDILYQAYLQCKDGIDRIHRAGPKSNSPLPEITKL